MRIYTHLLEYHVAPVREKKYLVWGWAAGKSNVRESEISGSSIYLLIGCITSSEKYPYFFMSPSLCLLWYNIILWWCDERFGHKCMESYLRRSHIISFASSTCHLREHVLLLRIRDRNVSCVDKPPYSTTEWMEYTFTRTNNFLWFHTTTGRVRLTVDALVACEALI